MFFFFSKLIILCVELWMQESSEGWKSRTSLMEEKRICWIWTKSAESCSNCKSFQITLANYYSLYTERYVFSYTWSRRILTLPSVSLWYVNGQISGLPNEKESVYGALDKWIAWETEFPLIAAAKALRILRQQRLWKRVIQVRRMRTLFCYF